MLKPLAALAVVAVVSIARPAAAQQVVYVAPPPPPAGWGPPPPSGLGLIITGSVFMGLGAVNLLTAPLCKTSVVDSSISGACFDIALGIGITFVAVGIPLLAVGVSRRHDFLEWRRNNAAAALLDVGLSRVSGGGVATWQATF
jgi:hypothetical protein